MNLLDKMIMNSFSAGNISAEQLSSIYSLPEDKRSYALVSFEVDHLHEVPGPEHDQDGVIPKDPITGFSFNRQTREEVLSNNSYLMSSYCRGIATEITLDDYHYLVGENSRGLARTEDIDQLNKAIAGGQVHLVAGRGEFQDDSLEFEKKIIADLVAFESKPGAEESPLPSELPLAGHILGPEYDPYSVPSYGVPGHERGLPRDTGHGPMVGSWIDGGDGTGSWDPETEVYIPGGDGGGSFRPTQTRWQDGGDGGGSYINLLNPTVLPSDGGGR